MIDVGQRAQIDHNEPGQPWVAHESYTVHDDEHGHGGCTGSRRVAYGATEEEARERGERNRARWPAPAGVPHDAAVGRA